jgi:pyrimidine operon attenuation protein/uracil phosphoribosyltransferase
MSQSDNETVLSAPEIQEKLEEMASAIKALAGDNAELVLIGIQRRGVPLAERLGKILADQQVKAGLGALDITLYRDDLETVGPRPVIGETTIPFELVGKIVVIVDDVLYTGRTIRAALDELSDFGRPDRIGLCVLVDRGGRELPIQADITGITVAVDPGSRVDVFLDEIDGKDAVELSTGWRK